jgi:hypothetical protein
MRRVRTAAAVTVVAVALSLAAAAPAAARPAVHPAAARPAVHLSVAPTRVLAGHGVRAIGFGCRRHAVVTFFVGDRLVGAVRATRRGRFNALVGIPRRTSNGIHVFGALCSGGGASTRIRVLCSYPCVGGAAASSIATAGTTAAAGTAAGTLATGSAGGSLPFTGVHALASLAVGAALLVLGATVLLALRRRRREPT